jgi:hypothetical protein
MIENLKNLVALMDSKTDFVTKVSQHYGTSIQATMRNWFQYWNVPEDKLPKVIEIAQNYLFAQSQRERQVLRETGYKFKEVV